MRERQLTFETMGGATVTVRARGKHYCQPRGYAQPPGTGPVGETCKTCKWCVKFRRWYKCEKASYKWTGGRRSDILASAPACRMWEAYRPLFRSATVLTESEMLDLLRRKETG